MQKIPCLIPFLIFMSCNSTPDSQQQSDNTDKQFDRFKESFIERLWLVYPGWASSQGYHKYDSLLPVPNQAYHEQELAFANTNLDSLKAFHHEKLSANNKTDYALIENALKGIEWNVNTLKEYEWNPASWNVCGGFGEMLNGTYAPLEQRLRSMFQRMGNVQAY
jgi:hypothetical protein